MHCRSWQPEIIMPNAGICTCLAKLLQQLVGPCVQQLLLDLLQ